MTTAASRGSQFVRTGVLTLSFVLLVGLLLAVPQGRAQAASETTLSWETFIPQARVAVPNGVPCDYRGPKYEYKGDNHGFNWAASGYRTATHAVINWGNKSVDTSTPVSSTTVYKAKTNTKVATRTASAAKMQSRVLGWGKDRVDLRMVHHAPNPFCNPRLAGAIDGAMTISIYKSGRWEIRSGNHRQMPSHMIYTYNGGRVTYLYRRAAVSPLCLFGALTCDLATLTGLSGTYS